MTSSHEEALQTLKNEFGDRFRPSSLVRREAERGGALASVMPLHAEEVVFLSAVAGRHSLRLVPVGAGTSSEKPDGENSILIRFDLMSGLRLPNNGEQWVEAEPGVPWLKLDNELRRIGKGLAVCPTSAPRTTVGGWLATDGLGVGSFEYGWLRENVLSASVVLPGGERREVPGKELDVFLAPGGTRSVVVGAKLRTRQADRDASFAAAFGEAGALIGAVTEVIEARLPLWHLAFISPAMARARNLGGDHLLFGAYPGERKEKVEGGLRSTVRRHRGDRHSVADAYRVWGQRFFPVSPSRPSPDATREFVSVTKLPEALAGTAERAMQGTIARSGEVLLLTLEESEGGEQK